MSRKPKTFADAIDDIERTDSAEPAATPADPLAALEREFRRIWTTLEGNADAGDLAARAKAGLETQMTKTPLATLGLIGLLALVVGYLLGSRSRE